MSGSTFGVLSAMILLAPAIGFAVASVDTSRPENLVYAQLVADASAVADQFLAGPSSTTPWQADPDNATSVGLAVSRSATQISTDALRVLRGGGIDGRPNGALDYEEARRALDMREGHFQLLVQPVPGQAIGWRPSDDFRVAYVAHYSGAAAAAAATPRLALSPHALVVEVIVTNQAEKAALFSVEVGLGNQSRDERSLAQMRTTPLLAPGQNHTVRVTYDALSAWDASLTHAWFAVTDPYGKPAADALGNPASAWLAAAPLPTSQPVAYNLVASAAQPYFVNGSGVAFHLDHFGPNGARVDGAEARIALTDPHGREVQNLTVKLPSQPKKTLEHACAACNVTGTYTLRMWSLDMQRVQVERVHLSAQRMFTEKVTLDPIAWREIQYLDALVPSFRTERYEPTLAAEGDVFGDDTNGPSEISRLLPRYDAVIVGSNVDHDALMPSATRQGIYEWTLDGGALLVLGLQHQPSRWLEATAGIGLQPTNAPGQVDRDNSLLAWPANLRAEEYRQHGRAWRMQQPDQFEAAATAAQDALLAVSKPHAFGNGSLVLSAYLPGLLTSPHDDAEGQKLLGNMLAHGTAVWSVRFGPDVPEGVPVAAWKRVVWAEDARHGIRVLVELELLRYA